MICHFIESQTVFYPFVSYFVCEGATDRKRVFCFDHETQATRDALFVGLLIALLAVKKGKKNWRITSVLTFTILHVPQT